MTTRLEKDTMGAVEVPTDAYYGAQTQRAVANFPISGLKPHQALVRATLKIKKCAALANMATGRLDRDLGEAIIKAADQALSGEFADQFLVDPFQAGAGTSHNMNVNEVLANRANELLGGKLGEYQRVNPNDHVNMAQSTNDVFPTAIRLAALEMAKEVKLELERLAGTLQAKGEEFDGILKSGRTHLQDAVPIRLGQEFAAYGKAVALSVAGIQSTLPGLKELGIGGTAVGTGLNAEESFIDLIVGKLQVETGEELSRGPNLIERMQNMDPFVALSSALKGTAINLIRIANDLRLLSSGPRTGLGEINLPPMQPGSSIMPGKVNPVLAEVTNMVCFQVLGGDLAITLAAQAGQLELNVMMPVIAYNILFSMEILKNCVRQFARFCVAGISANPERCRDFLDQSVGLATVLAPSIGYAAAAEVAKESAQSGKSIRQVILARAILSEEALDRLLSPYPLTSPGVHGGK